MDFYYANGRKIEYTIALDLDGYDYIDWQEPVEGITVIGVSSPVEYSFNVGAVEPFVYGAEKISLATRQYDDEDIVSTYDYYDVILDEFFYDVPVEPGMISVVGILDDDDDIKWDIITPFPYPPETANTSVVGNWNPNEINLP